MTGERSHGAFGAMTGWWATAARALALVLALAVATPIAGLAEDIAYHQSRHGAMEAVEAIDAASGGSHAVDPGLSTHVHCGCHVVVGLGSAGAAPPQRPRPRYARTVEAVSSVAPDRLPRPPRA